MKSGNIQEYLLLQDVHGPVMRLATPGGPCYRSVIEVRATYFNLSLDKQQELYEQYHRLFLGLDFPLQIIVRIQPLDIEDYLQYVNPALSLGESWQMLARDHTKFLRAVTKQKGLLGRRFYIVVPAEERGLSRWNKKEHVVPDYAEA